MHGWTIIEPAKIYFCVITPIFDSVLCCNYLLWWFSLILMQTCGIICLGRPWTTGTLWQRWPTRTPRFPRRERSTWCHSKSFILLLSIFIPSIFIFYISDNGKGNIENTSIDQSWNVLPEARGNPGWACNIKQAYLWHLCKHLNHCFTWFSAVWANAAAIACNLFCFLMFFSTDLQNKLAPCIIYQIKY